MSDLISRQGAIDAWDKLSKRGRTEFDQVLMTLPSAEPKTKCIAQIRINRDDMEDLVNEIVDKMAEPKTGHWIFNPKDAIELMFTLPKCSECGFESADCGNFCSNCGARMIEKDDEA